MVFAEPSAADSVIRIIGDRVTKASDNADNATKVETPPSTSAREAGRIRITGSKPSTPITLPKVQQAEPEPNQVASPAKNVSTNNGGANPSQKNHAEQPAVTEATKEVGSSQAVQKPASALGATEEELSANLRSIAAKPLPKEVWAPIKQAPLPIPTYNVPKVSISSSDNNATPATGDDNKTEPAADTIWDLYLAAKSNDPVLGRAEARVKGSKADRKVLFSTLLPHLDSNIGVQQVSQNLSNYNAQTNGNYDYTSLHYNVTARMTLLHVPTIHSLSAAAASLRGEQAGVAVARQNLIVRFTDSYFALLKAQADKQIALGEIKRLKQVLDQAQNFYKEGIGDIIAVYEAKSRLDGATADLTKSESTLRLAEQKLSSVVGKPVSMIANYLPQPPVKPDPDNLDWWVATMEREQPLLRQAREGLAQSAEQRKSVKAEHLPILQATGVYDTNRGTAALPTAEVRQWYVGASISMPLYSGGETDAKISRAVASEEERQHSFNETMDQQRDNIKQAFYNLRYNISLIRAMEQKMASAEIQLDAVKSGRNIGTRNAIDLLNAEQTYSIALRDYKYALYDNFIRAIQLKSSAGILDEVDVFEISKTSSPTLISRLSVQP